MLKDRGFDPLADSKNPTADANLVREIRSEYAVRRFRVAGLFAGIGGIELGFKKAGHSTELLCEIDEGAQAVLNARFDSDIPKNADVTRLEGFPKATNLVAAGFPCQDLSQAGKTRGIQGSNSGLVGEVFRLLRLKPIPWVVLENVPFMMQLGGGAALKVVLSELEELGYRWAYRIVNTQAFGIPHRRRRIYFVATLEGDPRRVLFADDAGEPAPSNASSVACGFYWTEGVRGLGWAIDSIPTLKGGSTVGIPSPPAVLLPSGEIVKPSIQAAEALQGFDRDWTKPAEQVVRPSFRWKLVGNAVSVPAAKWLGERLAKPGRPLIDDVRQLSENKKWPNAAYNMGEGRVAVTISEWPKQYKQRQSLEHYIRPEDRTLLSLKATRGFYDRTKRSRLRFPPGFIDAVKAHLDRMEAAS